MMKYESLTNFLRNIINVIKILFNKAFLYVALFLLNKPFNRCIALKYLIYIEVLLLLFWRFKVCTLELISQSYTLALIINVYVFTIWFKKTGFTCTIVFIKDFFLDHHKPIIFQRPVRILTIYSNSFYIYA